MREPNKNRRLPSGLTVDLEPCFSRFDVHRGGPFRDRKTGWLGSDEFGRAKASRSEDQHGTSLPLFAVQERVIFVWGGVIFFLVKQKNEQFHGWKIP